MTTTVVLIQRCMVAFAIILCYFHVQSEGVDCELYPFHYTCRGMMSRKRAMLPNPMFGSGCDGTRGDLNCIKMFEERRNLPYVPLPKSRLLITLLDDEIQKEIPYNAHHRQRNNEMDGRRTPLMQNFLSELEASDNNY